MIKGTIRLAYRKVIDATCSNVWEKYVWEATFQEYLIQVQNYDLEKKHATFSQLKNVLPKADKLHFLVSASVINYLKQLNGKVPDVLNNLGKLFLPFTRYKFEIIDTDIHNKLNHRIAIELISEPVTWIDTIDNLLLIKLNQDTDSDGADLTEMFAMRPFLSICNLKQA